MFYKIYKDAEEYLTGFEHTNTEQDTFELNPSMMDLDYLNCYKVVEDHIEWDEEKYQAIIEEQEKERQKPTWEEKIESQVMWTALETDTLLESEEE